MKILLFYHSSSYNRLQAIVRTVVSEIKTQFPEAITKLTLLFP